VNPLVVQLVKDALAGKYDEGVFKPEFISRERFFAEKDTCGYVQLCDRPSCSEGSLEYSPPCAVARQRIQTLLNRTPLRIQLAMKRKTKPALWLSALPRRNPNRPRNGKSQARESYRTRRDRFLAKLRNKLCPVALAVWKRKVPVAEVHHTRGRIGTLLNDERYWLAVSRIGHRWIHEHPQAARERGWLAERGSWGTAE